MHLFINAPHGDAAVGELTRVAETIRFEPADL